MSQHEQTAKTLEHAAMTILASQSMVDWEQVTPAVRISIFVMLTAAAHNIGGSWVEKHIRDGAASPCTSDPKISIDPCNATARND